MNGALRVGLCLIGCSRFLCKWRGFIGTVPLPKWVRGRDRRVKGKHPQRPAHDAAKEPLGIRCDAAGVIDRHRRDKGAGVVMPEAEV